MKISLFLIINERKFRKFTIFPFTLISINFNDSLLLPVTEGWTNSKLFLSNFGVDERWNVYRENISFCLPLNLLRNSKLRQTVLSLDSPLIVLISALLPPFVFTYPPPTQPFHSFRSSPSSLTKRRTSWLRQAQTSCADVHKIYIKFSFAVRELLAFIFFLLLFKNKKKSEAREEKSYRKHQFPFHFFNVLRNLILTTLTRREESWVGPKWNPTQHNWGDDDGGNLRNSHANRFQPPFSHFLFFSYRAFF